MHTDTLQHRIKKAAAAGEYAFWGEVVKIFPEAKSGDFPPEAVHHLLNQLEESVKLWVRLNTELMPYTPDSYDWFEAITAHLRRMGYEVAADETGGGIVCIIVRIGKWSLWFGTANENWGADVWFDDGFIDGENLNTPFPSDSEDTLGCAQAIRDAVEHFKTHKPEVPAHTHTCQQCDKVLKEDCHCERGARTNDWCSARCRAAFDL